MILDRPTHYPMILDNWEYKRQYRPSCKFYNAIIYVLHQMSAQYKNRQHKAWQKYSVQI